MPAFRDRLPQLSADLFLADGGLETTLVFDDGLDLPDFAAFPLLATDEGREALLRYYRSYADIARRLGVGIVLDAPTWRANPDWAARQGYDADALDAANRAAVALVAQVRAETPEVPVVLSGVIGPRGDGYVVGEAMDVEEARRYHAAQIGTFAATEADMVGAVTMTYVEEAIGVALAARAAGMPAAISFTVETDGRLPSGQALGEAIEAVEAATDGSPAYYMVNCAHPSHFEQVLDGSQGWVQRIGGVRANASRRSHAELDEAEDLDAGDPRELAAEYLELRRRLPALRVLGGCCGTSHVHVGAIGEACVAAATA